MQQPWISFAFATRLLRESIHRSSHPMARLYSTGSHWVPVHSQGKIPSYSVYAKDIRKSEQDDRDYMIIRLENGLQAMLVHDAKADKAAASLDVAVGHLYDPDDMPGLAHFCEHLLFMGTEQFPRENEYSEFLAKNNGASNAYTSTSNTNYYFNVATPALHGALDRFAGFFHSPLFSPSCTSRELNAVDSENKKNHQSDVWRIFQLNKHLSKEDHVWRKFGTGHRDSLSKAARDLKVKGLLTQSNGEVSPSVSSRGSSVNPSRAPSPSPSTSSANSEVDADGGSVGRETRRRLVQWWSQEYCANRMRLCVIGKEPLDELASIVSTLFTPIPNRGREPLPMTEEHPFGPNEMGTLVAVQTIMSFHIVEISFPLAYQAPLWLHKPANFLSHFVGHEGPGSIHSYLKNKGWVTGLSAGVQDLTRGFGMFKVTLHLTREGFHNYRSIILATFKYLSLLRSSSFPSWRPDDYAVWISQHMAWPVERDMVLSAPQLIWEWDEAGDGEAEVRKILDTLTIGRGRAVLMARVEELNSVFADNDVKWNYEPWYGTGFLVEKFDDNLIKEANCPNDIPELFLPGPNEFLPTKLDVVKKEVDQPLKRPHLIRETPITTLWHKTDDQFWVPKAQVLIDIRSPCAHSSPRTSVMTRLFSDLVNDSLTEFAYDADLAGLSYNFAPNTLGISISVKGYNDKLPVLAGILLEKIKGLKIKPERLAVVKEQLKRNWENFFLGQTYQISDYFAKSALTEKIWLLHEKLPEIPSITVDELEKHSLELYSRVSVRILVNGNMQKDEAINIADMTEKMLGASPVGSLKLVDRSLILPKASDFVWTVPVPNPNEPNSSLTYYLHIGSRNEARLRVIASLLSQILSEPAFNVLRTKEQLGYIVSCIPWILPGQVQFGLKILVQSERHPMYLEERVEAFLCDMKAKLEGMEDVEFAEQKKGLEKKWREGLKNLTEETNRYWTHIESGLLDFYRRDKDADLLEGVSKEDVISLFLAQVHPSSTERAKFSVHLCSRKPRQKKVSQVALEELTRHMQAEGLKEPDGWSDDLGEEPTVDAVKKDLQLAFPDEAGVELTKIISELVKKFPAESDNQGSLKAGSVVIEDWKQFRSSLEVSEDPKALVEWNDLPVSKM